MPTTKKRQTVRELHDLFTTSQVLVFTDYRGLKVSDITALRRQLRDKGVEYHVAKNTLTTLAANRAGMEGMNEMLDGPTAIAFINDDIPGAAKVLSDFVRTSRILQIRGGLMGSTVLTADQVGDLTKILSREEYIAKVLGSMQSPVSGLVNALAGTLRGFMNVMQAVIDQRNEGGEGATAEAAAVSDDTTAGDTSASDNSATAEDTTAADTETLTTDVDAPAAADMPDGGAATTPDEDTTGGEAEAAEDTDAPAADDTTA